MSDPSVPSSRDKAVHWMTVAAENGSLDARYTLGMSHIISDDPQTIADGARLLKLVVCQTPKNSDGYDDAYYDKAKYVLAYQMELGRVAPVPAEQMFRLYEAAAKSYVPEAMLATGHYLENGIGIEQNAKGAAAWYRKAAEYGHDEGHLLAGLLSGYDDDLRKAAKAGHVEAMLILARLEMEQCLDPYGFDSFKAGLNHYQNAASRGSLKAVLALAEIYEDGWEGHSHGDWWMLIGMDSESERQENALAYYEQAVELGCQWAAKHVERLQKILNEDEDDLFSLAHKIHRRRSAEPP